MAPPGSPGFSFARPSLHGFPVRLPRMSRLCIYPGTFDPFTNGHLDVLVRAAKLFDKVLVAVAISSTKNAMFAPEERVELIRANLRKLPHVDVVSFDGLLVEFAQRHKAAAIIRGLRALSDFEFEFNMALMNRHLEPEVETIFVMPNESFSYTSSTLVKQIAKLGGDVRKFVPPNVATALRAAFDQPSPRTRRATAKSGWRRRPE
jgi:pantetheine-phosphate adenylyltransferase